MSDKELRCELRQLRLQQSVELDGVFYSFADLQVVSTSLPVVVTAVERKEEEAGAGYVTVKPLLPARNNSGRRFGSDYYSKAPVFSFTAWQSRDYLMIKVGDIGLAVVAKHDISNINGSSDSKGSCNLSKI
ncbi:MAG: hypothetical protein ACLSE8_00115 [Parasutterella sp.]